MLPGRRPSRTRGTTRSRAWSTPAPRRGSFRSTARTATSKTPRDAGRRSRRVFSPPPEEVKFAQKVLEAIPDGRGVHMIDGKMQDDATWKQCKVMVTLAEMLAEKDPELAEAYDLNGSGDHGGTLPTESGTQP